MVDMVMTLLVALCLLVSRTSHAFQIHFRDEITHGIIDIGIGEPTRTYSLLLDTGSANTWIGAKTPYVKTRTSVNTGNRVSVNYGSGAFSGVEFLDKIILGPNFFVDKQSIGVASMSFAPKDLDVDGIFGLGPVNLTKDTVANTECVPTVTDNLFSQGRILAHSVTIGDNNITFGPTTSTDVTYTPITTKSPSNLAWGIDAGLRYGDATLFSRTAGIIDHGTTLLLIATDYYEKFKSVTGATTMEPATGLLRYDKCQDLKPLVLTVGGKAFNIPWNYYIWPRGNSTSIGRVAGACYLAVGDLDSNSGSGLDFIIGYNTLKHFDIVLDSAGSRRVGIARRSP